MSDIYYKDTKKALSDFEDTYISMSSYLAGDVSSTMSLLISEVDRLLDQYLEKLEKIDELEEMAWGNIEW